MKEIYTKPDLAKIISDDVADVCNGMLENYPIHEYLDIVDSYPPIGAFTYVSEKISGICDQLTNRYGEECLNAYHRIILVELIRMNYKKIEKMDIGNEIIGLIRDNFERIYDEIKNGVLDNEYLYSKDKFRKDIAVCSLRLIPAGARKIHLDRLPLSFIFKGGGKQFIEGCLFICFTLKGYKPLYHMHLDSYDPHLMSEFNPEGLQRFYLRVANILRVNRNVIGIFGSSWYNDPALEQISPHLAYLVKIVTNNGGKCFYLGPSSQSTKDAILKSKTRRKLYEEGKYTPVRYLIVWPRKELIRWSERIKMEKNE